MTLDDLLSKLRQNRYLQMKDLWSEADHRRHLALWLKAQWIVDGQNEAFVRRLTKRDVRMVNILLCVDLTPEQAIWACTHKISEIPAYKLRAILA